MTPLAEVVEQRMKRLGWNQSQLAAACGQSVSWVSKFFAGKVLEPELTTLWKMHEALGIPFRTLLSKAGFDVENGEEKIQEIERQLSILSEIRDDLLQEPDILEETINFAQFRLAQRRRNS